MSSAKELMSDPIGQRPDTGPETPYTRAQRAWDDRLGHTVVQTKNWRFAFFGVLSIALALSGGILYALTRSVVEPVVVTLEKDTGITNIVGRPSMNTYQPQQNEIRYMLKTFLRLVRTVPLDAVIVKQNWNDAYALMRQSAGNKLNEWARQPESPLLNLGKETVAIQVQSVLPITTTTYEARWSESAYSREGALKSQATYTATFTLEIEPPTTEEMIYRNPLGLYITDFAWHRDLSMPVTPASSPSSSPTP